MNDPREDARGELSAALAKRSGEPAADADQAAIQVAELRSAIDRDLAALKQRIPSRRQLTESGRRPASIAGVAAAATLVTAAALKRRRGRAKAEAEARTQALALARELARLELRPEDLLNGSGKGGAAGRLMAVFAVAGAIAAVVLAARRRLQGDDDLWDQPI